MERISTPPYMDLPNFGQKKDVTKRMIGYKEDIPGVTGIITKTSAPTGKRMENDDNGKREWGRRASGHRRR